MRDYIEKIIEGNDLTTEEMKEAIMNLMSEGVEPAVSGSFLSVLKMKGESVAEITGGAKAMREKASGFQLEDDLTLDTCGTGGDRVGTFNISTGVAIIMAALGVSVVKHGNRSVSSKCGCADVLEELGVTIDLPPEKVKECVEKTHIGFLFAQTFHSAMRHVGPIRKALGYQTIFNILGPLANPAHANYQLVGVYDEKLLKIFGEVLRDLGLKRALVVHGEDGLDEISLSGKTKVCELKDGDLSYYTIDPQEFGLALAPVEDIVGGDKVKNAEILCNLFEGDKGPMRDILLINAGAAIYLCDKADSIQEGIELAKKVIDDGLAKDKLNEFVQTTHELSEKEVITRS